MKSQNGSIVVILIITTVIVLVGVVYLITNSRKNTDLSVQSSYEYSKSKYQPSQSESPDEQPLTLYTSKNLNFSINLPLNSQVEENLPIIDIKTLQGTISITRNLTNFDELRSYIKDYDSKRELVVSTSNDLKINGYEATVREAKFDNKIQKSFYIYIENKVYIISTTTQSLYDDLDQIAQSFRYTP